MTRLQTKTDRRREAYLAAAMQLFAEHGFVGTSTDVLVAAVGGSKATLYAHFPTKDDLVAGLTDQLAAHINRTAASPELDDMPLEIALTAIGHEVLDGVVSPRAVTLLRLCLAEINRFPELARTLWERGPAVTYANFKRFVRRRERAGELYAPNKQLAAEHFVGAIAGHIQLKVAMGITRPPAPDDRIRRVNAAVQTFLARYGT